MKILLFLSLAIAAFAQNLFNPIQLSPPSIRNSVPVTFFSPAAPSLTDPGLVGPVTILKSGIVDTTLGTVTLPLYRGSLADGSTFWYILTDTSDQGVARTLGINYSYKLSFLATANSTLGRKATLQSDGTFMFDTGMVSFTPQRNLPIVTPESSSNISSVWPIQGAQAGSIGDDTYVPWFTVEGSSWIFNAPIIASDILESQLNTFCNSPLPQSAYNFVHDQVMSICPQNRTVTLRLTPGFSYGKLFFYLGMDSNDEGFAALENATWVQALSNSSSNASSSPLSCADFTSAFCPSEPVVVIINGQTNQDISQTGQSTSSSTSLNPLRQGINSSLMEEGPALHVFRDIPTVGLKYSPYWNIWLAEWTPVSILNHLNIRLMDFYETLGFVQGGWLTGLNGAQFASTSFYLDAPAVFRWE